MEKVTSATMVPHGPGGVFGQVTRMIVCVCTGGFVYPNAFVEGMDATATDAKTYPKGADASSAAPVPPVTHKKDEERKAA